MTSISLSNSLVYAPNKSSAASGHKYRQNLPTYNKFTFVPGDTMMLNIPYGRKSQFLNLRISYLKFEVDNLCQLTTAEAAANPVVAFAQFALTIQVQVYSRVSNYTMVRTFLRIFTNIMCRMRYGAT
jgi:hypothetical protein